MQQPLTNLTNTLIRRPSRTTVATTRHALTDSVDHHQVDDRRSTFLKHSPSSSSSIQPGQGTTKPFATVTATRRPHGPRQAVRHHRRDCSIVLEEDSHVVAPSSSFPPSSSSRAQQQQQSHPSSEPTSAPQVTSTTTRAFFRHSHGDDREPRHPGTVLREEAQDDERNRFEERVAAGATTTTEEDAVDESFVTACETGRDDDDDESDQEEGQGQGQGGQSSGATSSGSSSCSLRGGPATTTEGNSIDTRDSSLPSPAATDDKEDEDGDKGLSRDTTAPPRFVRVVETCPTPEHDGRFEDAPAAARGHPASSPLVVRYRHQTRNKRRDEDQRRKWLLESVQLDDFMNHESRFGGVAYDSDGDDSLFDLERSGNSDRSRERMTHDDMSMRRRRRRTREPTREDLLPTIESAAELVASSLLSCSSSRSDIPNPRAWHGSRRQGRGTLVEKSSTSTLCTYDLSHLPAPRTPLERPYTVEWLDVLKPSRYLGGGRASGKFGDVTGPVERKREDDYGRRFSSSLSRRSLSRSFLSSLTTKGTNRCGDDDAWDDGSEDVGENKKERVDTPVPRRSSLPVGRSQSFRESLSSLANRLGGGGSVVTTRSRRRHELDRVDRDEELRERQIDEMKPRTRRSITRSLSMLTHRSSSGLRERDRRVEAEPERLEEWVRIVVQ